MNAALTGGLLRETDYPILDPDADLVAGENHAFWFFDDRARYALLNCHIQAGGSVGPGGVVAGHYQTFPDWRTRRIVFPLAGPDDEILIDFAIGPGAVPDGYDIGGWRFTCEEPFVRWTGRYRGAPRIVKRAETLAGIVPLDGPRTAVEIDLDFVMALPPWSQGDFAEDLPGRDLGLLATGVPRYEQLYRVEGAVRAGGRDEYRFTGTGIRTHRYGKRVATKVLGSSWLSALFPSGRGFGSLQFLGVDGQPMYSEAFASTGTGPLQRARTLRAPWLESLDCVGRTFELELDIAGKLSVIAIEVIAAAYNYGFGVDRAPGALDFCHTMSRFRWDGEEALGMMELGMVIERLRP